MMLKAIAFLAVMGAAVAAATFAFFAPGFFGWQNLTLFWAMAPLPAAWVLSRPVARTSVAIKITLAGFAGALALALWLYADAIRVTVSGRESLAALILVLAPLMQFALLAVTLIAAAIASHIGSSRSAKD